VRITRLDLTILNRVYKFTNVFTANDVGLSLFGLSLFQTLLQKEKRLLPHLLGNLSKELGNTSNQTNQ